MSIHETGARFDVLCKRCGQKFEVIRNWGGGIRREGPQFGTVANPAECTCGSKALELF